MEIISLETPSLQPGAMSSSPYLLKSDEMLQWDCSVLAGEGDSLVWLLNGTVIPDIDNTQQVCKININPSHSYSLLALKYMYYEVACTVA